MFTSIVRKVSGKEFYHAVVMARKYDDKARENLWLYTIAEYNTFGCYLTSDGKAGFIVKPDGYMGNLFNRGSIRGLGEILFRAQVELGGTNFDCLDGFLPAYYNKFGFVEYRREPNWTQGEPDVVFMCLRELWEVFAAQAA